MDYLVQLNESRPRDSEMFWRQVPCNNNSMCAHWLATLIKGSSYKDIELVEMFSGCARLTRTFRSSPATNIPGNLKLDSC